MNDSINWFSVLQKAFVKELLNMKDSIVNGLTQSQFLIELRKYSVDHVLTTPNQFQQNAQSVIHHATETYTVLTFSLP